MKKDKNIRNWIQAILLVLITMVSVLAVIQTATAFVSSKTYTTDADFDEGILDGVNHDEVHDQLQLNKNTTMDAFIWIANSAESTVSKLDVRTGKEIGRYKVDCIMNENGTVIGATGDPSRTAVDLDGNAWIANRAQYYGDSKNGAVIKIAAKLSGGIDRNGNGTIDTSHDVNGNGVIDHDEILPCGQDELVLFTISLGNNVAPRGVAIDKDNNAWIGTTGSQKYFKLDGNNGTKLLEVSSGGQVYGAAIDKDGYLWSYNRNSGNLAKIYTSNGSMVSGYPKALSGGYGIAVDNTGHVWIGGYEAGQLIMIDAATGNVIKTTSVAGSNMRGLAVDKNGNVWVADSRKNQVHKFNNSGNYLASIKVGSNPVGVAVDIDDNVWVVNQGTNGATKINGTTNTVIGTYPVGQGPYTYSDMTGYSLRHFTTHIGKWTVIFDSQAANTPWGTVSWNSNEPDGTSVTVKVRSSNNKMNWSAWESVANGAPLNSTPDGRYIQIETTLQIKSGNVSPILYDLTVKTKVVPSVIKPPKYTVENNPYDICVCEKALHAVDTQTPWDWWLAQPCLCPKQDRTFWYEDVCTAKKAWGYYWAFTWHNLCANFPKNATATGNPWPMNTTQILNIKNETIEII